MARDAAGRDRMHIGSRGWINFDRNPETGEVTMTVSDGDGYTLPQVIEEISEEDQRLIKLYMEHGFNVKEQPMGPEKKAGDWIYILDGIDTETAGYRYRPMGERVQAEVYIEGTETWQSFGVFKDKDKMYGKIELDLAEPKPR